MEPIEYLESFKFWGNNGWDYMKSLIIFFFLMMIFKVFKVITIARLKYLSKKTKNDIDDFAIEIINNLKPPLYFLLALYFAFISLNFTEIFDKIFLGIFWVFIAFQAVIILQRIIDYVIEKKLFNDKEEDYNNKKAAFKLMGQMVKFSIWIIAILLVLSNMGVDVTSLVAGLGIGGIAVALALQGVLGDLFASVAIFIDQPFKVGDYVKAGTEAGTVVKVGMRTSRIQTLRGEELVVANTDISSDRIKNFSRMKNRRVNFKIGVTYNTGSKKLKKIPDIIKKIIEAEKDLAFSRARFSAFGDFALIFDVVYYVESPEVDLHFETQERVNLAIYEAFEKNKIEFAYPTQTVYLSKN